MFLTFYHCSNLFCIVDGDSDFDVVSDDDGDDDDEVDDDISDLGWS